MSVETTGVSGRPAAVLVGPPGSGKTTVGRLLAQQLGVGFADTDAVIEDRIGKTISQMFTTDGEDTFRSLERKVVAEALESGHGVLALGGGAVLAEATRTLLRGHRVVALDVNLADGMSRTATSTARPLLTGVDPQATFQTLLKTRAPLYHEVATVRADTSGQSPNQVVAAALEALSETHLPLALHARRADGRRRLARPAHPSLTGRNFGAAPEFGTPRSHSSFRCSHGLDE